MVAEEKRINWLTMKQVTSLTGLKPTTINRYKDEFPECIRYRFNGQMLEFFHESVPVLQHIYSLYQDRSEGRRTAEKVREILYSEFGYSEEEDKQADDRETLPIHHESTNAVQSFLTLQNYLQEQDQRLTTIESQNQVILRQQQDMIDEQLNMKDIMNKHLELLSTVARSRMEERQTPLWKKLLFIIFL